MIIILNITNSFSHGKSSHLRKNYAAAKEFCENASINGFRTGRLFEPKTQSINDKVYAESNRVSNKDRIDGIDDWIGIKYFKEFGERRSDHFAYTSSKTELELQNWGRNQPSNGARKDCVCWLDGKWHNDHCNRKHSFICEFV